MRCILNVLWLVISGWWIALSYAVAALVMCVTIVGIPFGVQLFKLAGYVLWPFGRSVVKTTDTPGLSFVGNLLWLPFGLVLALLHIVAAVLSAITIIGIPFAVADIKLAGLALTPFGRTVIPADQVARAVAARDLGVHL